MTGGEVMLTGGDDVRVTSGEVMVTGGEVMLTGGGDVMVTVGEVIGDWW